MTQQKQFKKGQLVFIHPTKKQGKILYINSEKVGIEVIVSQKGNQRVVEKEEWATKDISPLRSKKKSKSHNPNEMYYMVRDFHKAFNHKYHDTPTPMDEDTALNRAVWTAEELVELLYASVGGDKEKFINITDKFLDGIEENINKMIEENKPVDDILVAQADALTDVEYFNQGSFTILGVKPYNLFKIVQEANMGKLFPDGKPRFRQGDGKIIKPDNWERDFAPEGRLKEEIERQKGHKLTGGVGNKVTKSIPFKGGDSNK